MWCWWWGYLYDPVLNEADTLCDFGCKGVLGGAKGTLGPATVGGEGGQKEGYQLLQLPTGAGVPIIVTVPTIVKMVTE